MRRRREDYPLVWHHVFNSGVAKRALFETGADVAHFLDLIG
jgi:hypothetical protein